MVTEAAYKRLVQFQIKPSLQRIAVMDYLLNNRTHPTVDEIYNHLAKDIPTLSKTTVYNTLKLLVDQGAVLLLNIDKNTQHFDGDVAPHAHFRCVECGRIVDLPQPKVSKMNVTGVGELQITECQVYYKGYCVGCRNAKVQA